MHLRFAPELGHALAKCPTVDPDGLPESVIALKNRPELERKNSRIAEAGADNSGVLDGRFLIKLAGCVVIFADNHGEFPTGIAQNRSSIHPLHALQQERAASAGSIWEGLMLGKTIRVPRHVELSEPGWRRSKPPLLSSFCSPKLEQRSWK